MKKILTASLVAIMAVTAANADIASVDYVDGKVGDAIGGLDVTEASGTGNVVTSVTQADGKVVVAKNFTAASGADLNDLAVRVTAAESTLTGLTSGDASVDKKIATAKSEAIDAAADDATTKANNAQQAAIAAIGKADIVIKKNAADTGKIFNANAAENVELNLGLAAVATSGSYNDLSNKPTLGTLAAKSEVAKGDLADALASEINGKQVAALVNSNEQATKPSEQYPSVAYTETLINASKNDLTASKQDKFEAGNFLEFTTDSQGNTVLETTYTGEANVVTISNTGQIGVAASGITTAKIANDAVTMDKIKEGAIKEQHFDIATACAAGATCALVIKDGKWSWQTVQGLSAGN